MKRASARRRRRRFALADGEGDFANRTLSAMRRQFGGHQEKPLGEQTLGETETGAGPDVPAKPGG